MKTAVVFKILLSIFVLAVGGLALYEYRSFELEKEEKAKSEQLLPDIKIEDVKAIRLFKEARALKESPEDQAKKKPESLSIVKEGEDWLLLEPLQDLVSFTELSRWLDTIARHQVTELETENKNLSSYYLGSAPSVELELKSGERVKFSVSSKSSFDGRWFIKKGSQIFLAEQGIDKEIHTKELEDFRSRKILPSLSHANQIQIRGKENLTLNWSDYKWSLEGREESELPLDQSFLNGFWSRLTSLEASALLEKTRADKLKKYKLDKALLTVRLFYGEKEYVLKLSPLQEDKFYASISHRDYIFEVSKDKQKDLLISKAELYDHSFPFNFESPLVSEIQIISPKKNLSLKKRRERWSLIKGSKKQTLTEPSDDKKEGSKPEDLSQEDLKESAEETKPNQKRSKRGGKKEEQSKDKKESPQIPDPDKIQDFLNQIKLLKGTEYKKAKEAAPLRSLKLRDSKGEALFELWELERSKDQSWLKSSLWPEWIALPIKEADEIFNSSLLKENKEE